MTLPMRVCPAWVVALAAALAGCLADVALAPEARLACVTDADCPPGATCNTIGRCVSPERVDREGPRLVGAPSLSAATVRRGGAQRLTFELDEAAEVRVQVRSGSRARAMTEEPATASQRAFVYVADDADVEGPATLEAIAVDAAGNESRLALPGFLLDFTAPALAGQPAVEPAAARAGAELVARLATDDPVATASVRLVGPAGLVATLEWSADAYRWTVPADAPPSGDYEVLATLTDPAGNASADVRLGGVRIDRAAPAVEWRSEPTGPARAGTQATFVATADEPLAPGPALVLSDGARTKRLAGFVAGSVATFSYTVLAEDHGTWAVAVEGLTDAAGNAAAVVAGPFAVDARAPGFLVEPALEGGASLREGAELAVSVEPDETAAVEARFVDRAGTDWPLVATGTRFARVVTSQEAEGAGSVVVTLRDLAGNLTTRALGPVFVDRTPPARVPAFERMTPASPARANGNATLAFELVTSEPVVTVEALTSPDLGAFDVVVAGTRVLGTRALAGTAPADGTIQLDVRIADAAGNETTERLGAWTVDTTPPTATARDLAPTTARAGTRVSARLEPGEPVTARLTLGGAEFSSTDGASFALDVAGTMSEGDQPVMADLTDLAGNTARLAVGTVRVDFTPPRILPGTTIAPSRPVRAGDLVTVAVEGSEALSACSATIGGVAMERDEAVALPACAFRHVVAVDEGEGARAVAVTLVDAAGNGATSEAGSVTYDFTPPALGGADVAALPMPAGVDEVLRIVARASEPLRAATLTAAVGTSPPLPFSAAAIEGAVASWNRLVREGEPDGAIDATFLLVDLAGNEAEVSFDGVALVDARSPQVVRASVAITQLVKAGATVRVVFDSSEALAEAPAVTIGGAACERTSSSTPLHHECTHVVLASEGDGEKAVVASMFDGANRLSQGVGIVRYDFTPPKVRPTDLVAAPSPAGVGSLLRLAASADEPLAAASLRLVPSLALPEAVVSGRSAVWSRVVGEGDAQGALGARLQVTDLAGNVGDYAFDGVVTVDATVPAVVPGTLSLTRLAKVGDVVEISFESSEPLTLPPEVTVDGLPCARAAGSDATRHACTLTVPPTATSGLKRVDVVLRDGVNVGRAPLGAVTFDVDPPLLTAADVRALAPVVGQGGTVVVQARADEALAGASLEVIAPAGFEFDGPLVTGDTATWTHAVTAADAPGLVDVRVSVSDVAGNKASVEVGGLVRIDNVAPGVTGAATLSAQRSKAGDTVTLEFTASEELRETPEAYVGPTRIGLASTSGRTYRYAHVVSAAESEVLHVVHAKLVDAAGNASDLTLGLLTYDFTPPTVVPSTVGLTIDPPATSPVYDVTAAGLGSKVRLSFTTSEALAGAPVLTSSPDALSFASTLSAGSSHAFEALVAPGAHVDGAQAVRARMTDLAGNVATAVLVTQALVVDTLAPPAPAVAAADRIVHERRPWGTIDGIAAGGQVSGGAGAVEGGARVIIVDGASAAGARLASTARARPDGSFGPVDVGAVDRAQVGIVVVDDAGNASFAAVRDGLWTARPAADGTSPHAVHKLSRSDAALTDPSASLDPATPAATTDGASTRATAAFRWIPRPIGIGSPTGAEGAVMAYDAGRARAVLFGGASGGTWEWDGSRWAEATPAAGNPAARTEHALAYDAARGRVLLFGGRSGGVLFDDTWSWDGRAWTREYPATSPSARAFHAMAYDTGRGRVVLFGGRTDPALDVRSSETWEWDGTTWARQQPALEPPARERATLTYDPTRRASVLFGGRGRDPSSFIGGDAALADTWEWTGTAWRSVIGSAAPPGRYGHAAGLDATCGCVAVFGGATGTGAFGSVYGDTWVLGAGGSWTRPATTGPGGRFGMASAMVDGVWTLFGGRSSTAFSTERQDTWAWNAASARWVEVTPSALTPGPRYGHSMAYEPSSGKTNLVFGRTTAGGVVGTAGSTDHWAYDSRGWALVPGVAFNMPPTPRFGATGAVTGAGVLTLFGGRATDAAGNPTTYAAGTSGWNGASWSSSLVGAPPLRTAAGLAGAGASGGLFLFGGENSAGVLGDTWTWNGSGWAQLAPAAAPSARAGHAMVHDSVRARALAFGGSNGTTTNDETWAFDGTSWTRLTPTRSPAPRAYAAAAFDGRRGWGLLFGGNGLVFNSSSLDDLWVHDGTTWRLESPDRGAPPPRQRGAAVYDAARDRVVLFGGLQVTFPANSLVSEDRDLGDTWELLPPATPAVTASFDWSAAGVASSAVLETRLEAVGGGTGYTVAAPGGSALHGASLEGWDAQAGAWRQLATNAAPLSTPAGLVATTAAGEATRWFLRGTTAHVRLRPLASSGNGPAHAAVAVDAVQVRVKYRR